MTTSSGSTRSGLSPTVPVVCLCAVLLSAGCAARNHYHASKLPPDLLAQPQNNPQMVDLSRLASLPPSSTQIDVGDELKVTIAAGLTPADIVAFPTRVAESGMASIPGLGEVRLVGYEPPEAESVIRAAGIQKGIYNNPHVVVSIERQRQNRVLVMGAVLKQGAVYLPRGSSDLVSALSAAGGLAEDAGVNVEIRYPTPDGSYAPPAPIAEGPGLEAIPAGHTVASPVRMQSIHVDLVSAQMEAGDGYRLPDGSVVMVEKRDPMPVQVLGLVRRPGRYTYPLGQDLRVLDALALASGISSPVADKVFVIRPMAHSADPAVIQLSLAEAKRKGHSNLLLAPGDVVSVEQTPATMLVDAIGLIRFGVGASLNTLF